MTDKKISSEDRQKIVDALEAGRVEWSDVGKKYFERAGVIATNKPDFTVVDVEVAHFWGPWEKSSGKIESPVMGNKGGVEISWSTVSAGFGTLSLFIDLDGKLKADTEGMGKKFCKEVLSKLIDSLEDERP